MGQLTTHVLDTMHGCPAGGMRVRLHRLDQGQPGAEPLRELLLNADGRADGPLLAGAQLLPGGYQLSFDVAAYFKARGIALPDPPFLDTVPVVFGIGDAQAHYHVPLLVSPWSYATYRGS